MELKRIKCPDRNHLLWGWMVGIGALTGLSLSAHGQYDPNWVRNFRVGAVVGFNIKADFKLTGSSFGVGNYGPGRYDDGYVIRNPANTANDFTSNWGYDNDSQYDSASQTLTFHRTTEFDAAAISRGKSDEPFQIGFDMEYGGYPWCWDRMRLGFAFGFGFLPLNFSQEFSMIGTAQRRAFVHSTDLGGPPTPFFPPPGYQGNPSGGWNIHSDVLSESDAGSVNATAFGKHELDATLFAFRLGPSLFLDLHPKLGLALSAGPALGFITGEYKFDDEIEIDGGDVSSRGSFDVSDVLYGGYVNATLTYHATRNGDIYFSAQYMPLGSAEFNKGGRSAKLDLSGAIYLSAGINWPF
jgi:hypothetical protein